MKIEIIGNYDDDKTTTIYCQGNQITRRAYQDAINRMGLMEGDYPRLVDDVPAIIVMDRSGNGYAIIN